MTQGKPSSMRRDAKLESASTAADESRERQKRDLIDSLEAMRTTPNAAPAAKPAIGPAKAAEAIPEEPEVIPPDVAVWEREVSRLREQLRLANQTMSLLERDLQRIEQKALDAIAETGKLRRKIDALEASHLPKDMDALTLLQERAALLTRIQEGDRVRGELTCALHDSEQENARLVKNIELFTRNFCLPQAS